MIRALAASGAGTACWGLSRGDGARCAGSGARIPHPAAPHLLPPPRPASLPPGYSRDVGPGVYDVHSPLVPSVEWMADRIRSFVGAGLLGGDATRIHVNPDCG